MHFLLECPAYEDLRSKYIRFLIAPMPLNYTSVLNSDDVELVRNVSIFLFHAFKRRRYALTIIDHATDYE